MKRWVIIDVSDLDESHYHKSCYFIAEQRRPTILHECREDAEKELARLARNHSGGEFYLFETVAVGSARQTCAGMVGIVARLHEDNHREMVKALDRKPRRKSQPCGAASRED